MTIRKGDASKFVKHGAAFDIVSRGTIQAITDPVAAGVYVYLMTKPETWIPREQEIRDHFGGMSKYKYRAAMRSLRILGLVRSEIIRGAGGKAKGSCLVLESMLPDNRTAAISESPSTGYPVYGPLIDTESFKDTEKGKETPIKPPDRSRQQALFDRFWKAYPRKVGKPQAQKAFDRKIRTDELLDTVLLNMAERLSCGEWDPANRKQYIPHPSTWLNRDGWQDDITPPARGPGQNMGKARDRAQKIIDDLNQGDATHALPPAR